MTGFGRKENKETVIVRKKAFAGGLKYATGLAPLAYFPRLLNCAVELGRCRI